MPQTFALLSAHDPRWPTERMRDSLAETLRLPRGEIETGPMLLRAAGAGVDLPMGGYARWSREPAGLPSE